MGVRRRPRVAGHDVVYSTHNVGEAEHYADRVLVLADGELLFTGTPAQLRGDAAHFEHAFVGFLQGAGSLDGPPLMRWLLLKDLQILRRSKLLLATIVLYPLLLGVVVGIVSNSGSSKPRVAFLNEVPETENEITLGGEKVDASKYANQIFDAIDPVRVKTREEAVELVRVRPRRRGADRSRRHHRPAAGRAEPRRGGGAAAGGGALQRREPAQGGRGAIGDHRAAGARQRGALARS